jgi:hypothetical protein
MNFTKPVQCKRRTDIAGGDQIFEAKLFHIKNETEYMEKSLTKLEKPKEKDPAGSVASNEPT